MVGMQELQPNLKYLVLSTEFRAELRFGQLISIYPLAPRCKATMKTLDDFCPIISARGRVRAEMLEHWSSEPLVGVDASGKTLTVNLEPNPKP